MIRIRMAAMALVTFLLLQPGYALGQEVLTLDEAYRLALLANEEIQIAEEDLVQGRLLVKQAITVLIPKLTARASTSRIFYEDIDDLDSTSYGLSLDQTLFAGGRTWIAKKGADYTVEAAEYGLAYARQSLLFDLLVKIYDVLLAERLILVDEDSISRAREQLRSAEAKFEVGDAPITDTLGAKVALSRAELTLVESRKELVLARRRLQDLIETSVPEEIGLPPDVTLGDIGLESYNSSALTARADLAQGRELIRISEQEAKLTGAGRRPDIKLSGSYNQYTDQVPFVPEGQIDLTLNWPFFQGGLVSLQAKEAYSRTRQAEEGYARQVKGALLEVESAYRELEALNAQSDLVEKTLADARENYRLERLRFELGDATSLDVLAAQASLTEAETLDVTHRYQTRLARAALLYFVGGMRPEVFGMTGEERKAPP